jgi:hypothetical protein
MLLAFARYWFLQCVRYQLFKYAICNIEIDTIYILINIDL